MNLHLSRFLFTIITINLFLSPFATGDATLIDTICTKTPYPRDCHVCFSGNSGSSQMNLRELAGTAMDCTYTISKVVQQAFVDLASRATDPTVKGVYDRCGSGFGDFVNKLSIAMARWWNFDDSSAKDVFGGAKSDYDSCKDGLSKLAQQRLPPDLNGNFVRVNNLYSDSGNIIIQSEANTDHY